MIRHSQFEWYRRVVDVVTFQEEETRRFLVGLLTEHGTNFFDRLVLGLGHLLPGKPGEKAQETNENDEHVGTQ